MRKLIHYYFYSFLFIDLLNGLVIRYLGLSPVLSPGQIARGVLTIVLLIDLVYRNRITKQNKYIYMFLVFFPVALFIYIYRDGLVHSIPIEIIWYSKPLFFLLLLNYVYENRYYFVNKLNYIMKVNLIIYVSAIYFSAATGLGISNYEWFYSSTKSFFYGNNVTSITGFILCIYYSYRLRLSIINLFYFILAFIALFLSGGKIILFIPLLTFFIYFLFTNKKKINKIIIRFSILFIIILFVLGLANPSIFINNNFTQKYYSRAFNELFSDNSKRSEMYFTPLRWYSYVSSTRAVHANYGLKTIINDPINIYFGYGIHNNQKKFRNKFTKIITTEMDNFDMLIIYGIIGFLIIYTPILKIMGPLIIRRDLSMNAMLVYSIFLYSSFAGHVLAAPMAGSFFALFLGISFTDNKIAKGFA